MEATLVDGRTTLVTNITVYVAPPKNPIPRRDTTVNLSVPVITKQFMD